MNTTRAKEPAMNVTEATRYIRTEDLSRAALLLLLEERTGERDALLVEATASRHEATHDVLTGLANRRALFTDTPAHLFVTGLDLDGLKAINDNVSHAAGDLFLQEAAAVLAMVAVATGGTAYRLGGDEFVLLTAVDPSELLAEHVPYISYGMVDSTGDLAEDLKASDKCMYSHKAIRKAER